MGILRCFYLKNEKYSERPPNINEVKIEIITKQILETTSADKVSSVEMQIKIKDLISNTVRKVMLFNEVRESYGIDFTPKSVIENKTFEEFLTKNGIKTKIEKKSFRISTKYQSLGGPIKILDEARQKYDELFKSILSIIQEYGISKEQLLLV